MKTIVLLLVAMLAGTACADPKPVAGPKPICICGDECKCKKGDCPGKCPRMSPRGDYAAARAAVERGERIVLCVGVPAVEGAYVTASHSAIAPGIYDCFLVGDRPSMQPRSAATVCVGGKCYSPYSAPPVVYSTNPFGSCPSGQCPKKR